VILYSIEWVIGFCVGAAILGGLAAYLLGRSGSARARIEELTNRLEETELEREDAVNQLTDYRKEVFDQFSETAVKFKALNDSYADLHQHLATSASVLCGGDAAGLVIEGPQTLALEDAGDPGKLDTTEVGQVSVGETASAGTGEETGEETIESGIDTEDEFDRQNALAMDEEPAELEQQEADSESLVEEAEEKTRGTAMPKLDEDAALRAESDAESDAKDDTPSSLEREELIVGNTDQIDPDLDDEDIVIEEVPVLSDIARSDPKAQDETDERDSKSTIERALNVQRDQRKRENG
jgi:uncharacterized membrane-anchored protein YhcB (DUF1043 family)